MRSVWVAAAVAASLVLSGCSTDVTEFPVVGIRAEGCGPTAARGSGVVVAPGVVLTTAHTVAGNEDVTILLGPDTHVPATVVGFDPSMDLTYLRVPAAIGTDAAAPRITSERAAPGATGHAVVFRDGERVALDVEVRGRVQINTENIYVEADTTRPGVELSADIELGDSGGAVVIDGDVIGVLWARTRSFDDNTSYAIDVGRARDLIDQQLATGTLGPGVDLSRCP